MAVSNGSLNSYKSASLLCGKLRGAPTGQGLPGWSRDRPSVAGEHLDRGDASQRSAILMRLSRSVSSSASGASMASIAVISPRSSRHTVTSRISIAWVSFQVDKVCDAVDERGNDLGVRIHPPWPAKVR